MTETITTIRTEDLHARPNARPTDAVLVEQIAASMRVIGFRPEKPIMCVRDGNIYWVIDGEHRRQAAIIAGIDEVPCAVEELDDAGVLTYEGALNVQRPDTEREKWMRAQGFLALGSAAVPESVHVATGIAPDAFKELKRAAEIVNDPVAFEDMNLDWALAVADLEKTDRKAAEVLARAKADEWERELARIKREKAHAEDVARAEAVIEAAKVKRLKGAELRPDGYTFICTGWDKPDGAIAAQVRDYGVVHIAWYAAATGGVADPEAEARQVRLEQMAAAAEARITFVAENVDVVPALKRVAEAAWEAGAPASVRALSTEALESVRGLATRMVASVLSYIDGRLHMCLRGWSGDTRLDDYSTKESGALALRYFDALEGAGYKANDEEAARVGLLRAAVKKQRASKKEAGNE